MSIYQPRPYQTNCIAALAEARENGTKKGLVVMASGLGKTLTAIFDLQQFLQDYPNARILCLCHQESILLQSKAKFQKLFGEEYSYGMFTGTYKTSRIVTFLFATFQTMRDHRDEFASDTFDYVVVDEAHHTAAETYQPTADYFEPLFLLGLTATKDRMDGQDILETYEQVLYEMDIYDGWNEGWLARVDYRIMLDDLNEEEFEKYVGSHAISEKVSLSQLNKTIFAPQHDEGIVASIREQTADLDNPSIFVFCSGIEHANAMAGYFGGEAAVIHSGQSTAMNEAILDNFRSGDIRIIISVNMLNEGIDVPEANVVVFLRSTESSTIFFQQLGRGLRISGDSRIVRVLDYVANLERIAMILDMEETARKRIASSPRSSSSASKPNPIVVNIPATKFRVQRVDIERALANIDRRQSWSTEKVITYFRDLACELGKASLAIKDFRDRPGAPTRQTVRRLFGSCAAGIMAAGLRLESNPARRAFEDEAELFAAAREYAIELGHPDWLTTKEIIANRDFPTWETLRQTYHNLDNFLRLAGFPEQKQKTRKKFPTKESVDQAILAKSTELGGKTPTRRQLDSDHNCPSIYQIKQFYDSLNDAYAALGLVVNTDKSTRTAVTHENQQAEALAMYAELGRAPTMAEWDASPKTCRAHLLERRYGSYNNAMLAFGIAPNKRHISINPGLKKTGEIENGDLTPELIGRLRNVVRRTGKPIRGCDLEHDSGLPSTTYFYSRGWTMSKVNKRIGADQILAELAKENN